MAPPGQRDRLTQQTVLIISRAVGEFAELLEDAKAVAAADA
jgi:hypothetical protein